MANAFHIHGLEIDLAAKGDAGQDGQLVGGVDAIHIKAGIGFGITQFLRLGQHVVELAAAFTHLGEDIVAGSVEDAVDPADAVARQALAQRLDDRDTTRHRRFITEVDPGPFGGMGQFRAVVGDQRLVGGDHIASGGDGRFRHVLGDAFRPADQLDDHIGVGLGG